MRAKEKSLAFVMQERGKIFMMNYDIFKEVVVEQFLSYMPEEFANHKVEVRPVNKVNQTLDNLTLIPPEGRGVQAIPTISINNMYQEYLQSENLRDVLTMSAFNLGGAYRIAPQNVAKTIEENTRDRVVMMLINTEQNKELLETVPHREFRDLSIVYRIVTDIDATGMQSALIKNELAEHFGMDEQTLYTAAVENTKRIFPPVTMDLNDIVRDMFISDGMPEEIADLMIGEMPTDRRMYVITNERKINGAVSMLYENELHTLAEQLETDLYILPSSIHECIAVSAALGDPNELAQMVADVNMSQVDISERLSNQVYHYDKDLRKLTLATDTPNKRLDGIVAEPQLIYDAKQSR